MIRNICHHTLNHASCASLDRALLMVWVLDQLLGMHYKRLHAYVNAFTNDCIYKRLHAYGRRRYGEGRRATDIVARQRRQHLPGE